MMSTEPVAISSSAEMEMKENRIQDDEEDDDDAEYDEGFQHVALAPIEGEGLEDDGDDQAGLTSASKYLRQVMKQAKSIPHIAVASPEAKQKRQPSEGYLKKLGPTMRVFKQIASSKEHQQLCSQIESESVNMSVEELKDARIPSEEWQLDQLEQFVLLHHHCQIKKAAAKENNERGPNIPSANNEFIWCCELYGKDFACKAVDIDNIPKTFRKRNWYLKLKQDMELASNTTTPQSEELKPSSASEVPLSEVENRTSTSETEETSSTKTNDDSFSEVLNERNEQILESDKPIRQPVLSFMIFLPQVAVECLLQWHYEWFCDEDNQQEISSSQNSSDEPSVPMRLNNTNCLWVYSLLSVLEKPVSPDTVYILRQLCRECKNIRTKLSLDDDDQMKDIAAVNLVILIITRFFDQFDLADP